MATYLSGELAEQIEAGAVNPKTLPPGDRMIDPAARELAIREAQAKDPERAQWIRFTKRMSAATLVIGLSTLGLTLYNTWRTARRRRR